MRFDIGTGDGIGNVGGGPTWLNRQYVYVTWTWPSNVPNPPYFEVVAYTGTDPSQTDTYVFQAQTVPGTDRHLQMVITPTTNVTGIQAAVRSVYE